MGYYIECPEIHGKAQWIAGNYDGELLVHAPASYAGIPEGKALIVVTDNGIFEAAGFACSEQEFRAFTDPQDHRPKVFLLIDRKVAEIASGYDRPQGAMPDYRVLDPESVKAMAKA